MVIKSVEGDLLQQQDVDAIVNTVNCVGVMGKGIALQFKKKWPNNFKAYAAACKAGEVKLGQMFTFELGPMATPQFIINFPTKGHWRSASRIEDIESGLADLVNQITLHNISSIAIPPLGCGNGGLLWADVKPLVIQYLSALPSLEVRLFEPTGSIKATSLVTNTSKPKMTPGRAAILALLETYKSVNYGLSKIEVQKLAYFLQVAGQDLKLTFVKHHYGPYADALRHALERMDGHYIQGVGDGVVEAEITPVEEALIEAKLFLDKADSTINSQIQSVADLIDGYQSPYGVELLSTVHWLAKNEGANTPEQAFNLIQHWNDRKKQLMTRQHVESAWTRLKQLSWI
ncbi:MULTISPECIES: type II toxin-antitoxin system antitoxin DNA ADP-ribosyl glycohydrolase DarG [Shewanella]|uniref:type II toxin-antitoxin system antitoxin DNA ADP-ribosyl glycohydrolase DarG n=1 Tax=Shewanella TaxID=22 RepID=UPI00200E30DE|nr:macro domain-containing protein [Shewanella basaltis]MCL1114429.1 macro domain-containing protein [Shewanella basaltis]